MGNIKPVKGYEDRYLIHDDGKVWSIRSDTFLQPLTQSDGRQYYRFANFPSYQAFFIDELLLEHFVQERPGKRTRVLHTNGDMSDCSLDNIEWDHKTFRRYLSDDDKERIAILHNNFGLKTSVVARQYGISTQRVRDISRAFG